HEQTIRFYDEALPTDLTALSTGDRDGAIRRELKADAARLHENLLNGWYPCEMRAEEMRALHPGFTDAWGSLQAKHMGLNTAMRALGSGFMASKERKDSRSGLTWANQDVKDLLTILDAVLEAIDRGKALRS
ncbi:MAG: hypothetical protein ABGY41_10035, partial [Candidatus Poribacteria bacterium]